MSSRSVAVDILRGVAILLVLVRHWPTNGTDPIVLVAVRSLGWFGVDLFFVISGYLISTLLYRELETTGRIDLARFWIRRGLRIWPAYFAAFLGAGALALLFSGLTEGDWSLPREQWPNLFLIQNYFPEPTRWAHTWSLAIEEHFYLLLPLMLLLLGRRRLLTVAIALCVTCLALRCITAQAGGAWPEIYYPSHLRFDALMVGVMVGYACHYHPAAAQAARRCWPLILGACAAILTVVALNPLETSAFTLTVGFSLLDLAFGGLVLLAAAAPQFGRRWLAGRLIAKVGVYSYTLYLAHGAMLTIPGVSRLINWAVAHGGLLAGRIVFVVMAAIGALLLTWLVEQPALRFRAKLTRRGPLPVGIIEPYPTKPDDPSATRPPLSFSAEGPSLFGETDANHPK